MAVEILSVPEEHLREVIQVIRAGLQQVAVDMDTRSALEEWCDAEESYLESIS